MDETKKIKEEVIVDNTVDKLKAMEDRIKELEEEKKVAINVKDKQVDTRSKDIETSRVMDLEKEIEAMKHLMDDSKEIIINETRSTIKLEGLISRVSSDKKDLLNASLAGKTIEEKLEFLDKHSTTFLAPDMSYSGNSGALSNHSANDVELQAIMNGDFVKESGLTEDEVKKFLKEDDIRAFENRLRRQYSMIRTSDDVFSFFEKNKGGLK